MVYHPPIRAGSIVAWAALAVIGLAAPAPAGAQEKSTAGKAPPAAAPAAPAPAVPPAGSTAPADSGPSAPGRTDAAGGSSSAGESSGSAPQVPATLSLKKCLELALRHNANYQQALVDVANADSRLRATDQLRHLALASDLEFGHSSGTGNSAVSTIGPALTLAQPSGAALTSGLTVPGYNSPSQGGQASVDYTLPLLRGRGRGSDTRVQLVQAKIGDESARLQQFESEQSLINSVVQDYYAVVEAKELLHVQQQAVDIAQEATTDAQKRLDAGLITEIDVTRAKLQLSSARVGLLSQQQQYQGAIDNLVLILGLPVGAQPELTDTVQYAYSPVDEKTAVQTALQRRPELGLIRLSESDADVQLASAQTHRKPQADVHFNLSSLGFSLFGGAGLTTILSSLLGLHVNVPVRERALQENIHQAERNRVILDSVYEFRRQGIVTDIRSLIRQAETDNQNVSLLTDNLEVAKKSVHIAQRMIEEGLADNRNLLDAESSQTATESGLLSAQVHYYLAAISLRQAMGLSLREYFGLPAPTDELNAWNNERVLVRALRGGPRLAEGDSVIEASNKRRRNPGGATP